MNSPCPLCDSSRENKFSTVLLKKYNVSYNYCTSCGLLQTETPYWLEEAYSEAIADADTGLVSRNLSVSKRLAAILFFCFQKNGRYLDTAGGYGMLTRLMRDIGFDFYWSDPYCSNILAKGFEAGEAVRSFSAVTAFEVLEHVQDPIGFISESLRKASTSTFIFTTVLFEGDPPQPSEWWYYARDAGQHISFYQHRTLAVIADKLSLRLYTNKKNFHVLTDERISNNVFRLMASRFCELASMYVKTRMTPRTFTDHQMLSK
jgi:hypothetical protein